MALTINCFDPLSPSGDEPFVLVGGGRNAHNIVCLFEPLGIKTAVVLDDFVTEEVLGHPVQGIDNYDGPYWHTIMTVTDPVMRRALVERPALSRCLWASYVDSRSVVPPHVRIGKGSFIWPFVLTSDVDLGRHVTLMPYSSVGARAVIGDFTCLSPRAQVSSDTRVGSGCQIGMGASVGAGLVIGNDCVIAPNVFVHNDMPDGSMAVGGSARVRIVPRPVKG